VELTQAFRTSGGADPPLIAQGNGSTLKIFAAAQVFLLPSASAFDRLCLLGEIQLSICLT
jgi:hypothetical protein